MRQQLAQQAEERRRAAVELQALVAELTGFSDVAMLDEAARAEDSALGRYGEVLATAVPPPVHAVAVRHGASRQRR